MARLDGKDFEAVSSFAKERWGLVLDQKKRVMVENRILGLRKAVQFDDVASLVDGLQRNPSPAVELALFDALSTNHTTFFRESSHFDLIQREILGVKGKKPKGLRFWSAGCSSGCEPYTLSILFHEAMRSPKDSDCRILATDLSTTVLDQAKLGLYERDHIGAMDRELVKKHMDTVGDPSRPQYQVKSHLRSVINFHLLNLLGPWRMKGPFDVIFCRNVMIYFDAETREKLAQRFLRLLKPGGLLFVGTSESLSGYEIDADMVAIGAYRKRG